MRSLSEATESKYFANLSFDNTDDGRTTHTLEALAESDQLDSNIKNHELRVLGIVEETETMQSGKPVSRNVWTDINNNSKPVSSPSQELSRGRSSQKGIVKTNNLGNKVDESHYNHFPLSKETIREQKPSTFFSGNAENILDNEGTQPKGVLKGNSHSRNGLGNHSLGPYPSRPPDSTGGHKTPRTVRFVHEFEDSPPYESYFHEMKSSIEDFEKDPQSYSPERDKAKSPEKIDQTIPVQKHLANKENNKVNYGNLLDSELFCETDSDGLVTDSDTVCTTSDTSSVDTLTLLESCDFSSDEGFTPEIVQMPTMQTPKNVVQLTTSVPVSKLGTFTSLKPRRGSLPKTDPTSLKKSPQTPLKSLSPARMQSLKLMDSPKLSKTAASVIATNRTLPLKPTQMPAINKKKTLPYEESQQIIFEQTSPMSSPTTRNTPGAFSYNGKSPEKAHDQTTPVSSETSRGTSGAFSSNGKAQDKASEQTSAESSPTSRCTPGVLLLNIKSQDNVSDAMTAVSSLTSRSTPGAFSPILAPRSSPFETSPRPLSPGMPKTPRGVKTPDVAYTKSKSSQPSEYLYGFPLSYQNPSGLGEHAIHAREEFTLWANSCLKYSSSGRTVISLERDLADGLTLIELVKVLVDKQFNYIPKYHTNPTIAIQRIENIKLCLEFLESVGMNLTGIIAEEIAEANLKACLAICHCLRQRFPIFTGESLPSKRSDEEVIRPTHGPSTPHLSPRPVTHKTAPSLTDSTHPPSSLSSPRTSLSSSLNSTEGLDMLIDLPEDKYGSNFHALEKDDLAVLSWVSRVVERSVFDYEGLQNGKVLCHLINKVGSHSIPDLAIQYCPPLERLKVALQTAEEHLGVFTELTPTDIIMVQRSHLVRDFLCDLWRLYDTKINSIKEQMAKEKEEDKERRRQELVSRYEQEMELCSDLNTEKEIIKKREEPWNSVDDFHQDNDSRESFSEKFRKLKEQMNESENWVASTKGYTSSDSSDSITNRWKASPKTSVKESDVTQKVLVNRRRESTELEKEKERAQSPTQDSFKKLFTAASAVDRVSSWKHKSKTSPSNKQLKDMSRAARVTMLARIAAKTGSAYDDDDENDVA